MRSSRRLADSKAENFAGNLIGDLVEDSIGGFIEMPAARNENDSPVFLEDFRESLSHFHSITESDGSRKFAIDSSHSSRTGTWKEIT